MKCAMDSGSVESSGPVIRARLTTNAHPESLGVIRSIVRRVADGVRMPPGAAYQLMSAVDEAVANIMEHGYGDGDGPIRLDLQADRSGIQVVIQDRAARFEMPSDAGSPEFQKPGKVRGFGLFMIRRLVDEVRYRATDDGGNELSLVKRMAG